MRTVLFHLRGTTPAQVSAALQGQYPEQVDPWVCFKDGDAVLYIRLYTERAAELGPDRIAVIEAALGGVLSCSVSTDVSGRHEGDQEVLALAELLLGRFPGVAEDDYSDHLWTLAEIPSMLGAARAAFADRSK